MNFLDTKFKPKHKVGQIAGLWVVFFGLGFDFGGFYLFPSLISFFLLGFGLNWIFKIFHDLELLRKACLRNSCPQTFLNKLYPVTLSLTV